MSDDIVSEIKHRLPIEQYIQKYITLRRSGTQLFGLCPFHQEKSPSFAVNPSSGFFHCFGCHASGDIFSFAERYHGLEFKEALHTLAEELGLSVHPSSHISKNQTSTKQQLFSMYKIANTHFVNNLHKHESSSHLEYFRSRGLSNETIHNFSLGYSLPTWDSLITTLRRNGFSKEMITISGLVHAKNNKIYDAFRDRYIFPIMTTGNIVIAFGGRIHPNKQQEQAKYINSPESPIYTKGKTLYGLPQARKQISIQKTIMITEGYFDVLTLHQHGYNHAVAVLGTALTRDHVRTIASFASHVELVFDADTAGQKATLTAARSLLIEGIRVHVILLPQGEDIDSFLKTFGKDAFEERRIHAKEGLDFCIEHVQHLSPKEITSWIQDFVKEIEEPLLLDQYVKKLSSGFGISAQSIYTSTQSPELSIHKNYPPSSTRSSSLSNKEYVLLTHLLTYPHNRELIQNAGLEFVLHSKQAREIAHAIYEKGSDHHTIYAMLSPETQPLFAEILVNIEPSDKEHYELQDILHYLEKEYLQRNTASASMLITDYNDIEGLSRIQNIISSYACSTE